MSHSVPSESSATETTFIVGADLVQFDRHELPIYQTPESQMGRGLLRRGAVRRAARSRVRRAGRPAYRRRPARGAAGALAALSGDDPLVVLAALSDGLMLPASEPAAEIATGFDFGADSHPIVHLHDGWSWDIAGADWTFDFHA